MNSVATTSPSREKPRRFNWPRVFGYDFFISFKLGPPPVGAQSYASDLARRLRELDFTVFFSEEEASPGEKLDSTLVKALRRSRILVVVANEGALVQSLWVRKEVEEFRRRHPNRPVIPINVGRAIENHGPEAKVSEWLGHDGRIWLDETDQVVHEGIASPEVVRRLAVTPRFIRANRLLRWVMAGIFAVISGLAVFAGYEAWDAKQKFKDATAMRLAAQGSATTAGLRSGGSLRGIFKILTAHRYMRSASTDEALKAEFLKLRQLMFLRELPKPIKTVAFSPDGVRIVTGSEGNTLQFWDARTGEPIGAARAARVYRDRSIAFSPDGTRIAASNPQGGGLMLLDANTGEPVATATQEASGGALVLAYSRDGRRIVSASGRPTLWLWDAQTGQVIQPLEGGHKAQTISVALSPDGTRVVSGDASGVIRLWNADTGQTIGEPIKAGNWQIVSLAFNPDGSQFVSGNYNNTLTRWDPNSGRPIGEPLSGHTGFISSVSYSPDGKQIVSGGGDGTLRLWDANTGESIGKPLEGHLRPVVSVAFSPDGKHLVSGGDDGTLRLWDPWIDRPAQDGKDRISFVALSRDGHWSVTNQGENSLQVWNAATGEAVGQPLAGHTDRVTNAAFSPDGKRIVSGSHDGTLRLWDAQTGQQIGKPLSGHTGWVTGVTFSPDGRRLVSGSQEQPSYGYELPAVSSIPQKHLLLWNMETGEPAGKVLAGPGDGVSNVAFSPDGTRFITVGGSLRLWEGRTGEPVGAPLAGSDGVASVAFSPDGRRIVGNDLKLWDTRSGQPIDTLFDDATVGVSAAFSPDGKRIVSVDRDDRLRAWDAATGEAIGRPIEKGEMAGGISSVVFSPNGNRLVLNGSAGAPRLWEIFDGWAESLCAKLNRNPTLEEWAADRGWRGIDYICPCPGLPGPPACNVSDSAKP